MCCGVRFGATGQFRLVFMEKRGTRTMHMWLSCVTVATFLYYKCSVYVCVYVCVWSSSTCPDLILYDRWINSLTAELEWTHLHSSAKHRPETDVDLLRAFTLCFLIKICWFLFFWLTKRTKTWSYASVWSVLVRSRSSSSCWGWEQVVVWGITSVVKDGFSVWLHYTVSVDMTQCMNFR